MNVESEDQPDYMGRILALGAEQKYWIRRLEHDEKSTSKTTVQARERAASKLFKKGFS